MSPVSPRTAPPPRAIATPVQCTGRARGRASFWPILPGLSGNRLRHRSPGTAFVGDIAMTALAPGRGLPERNCRVTFCPGRGVPGPRPPWRYSHGPLQGEIPEKNQTRLIPGYQPGHCPRPYQSRGTEGSAPWGRGRRPDMVCYFGIDVLDTITIFL